MEQITLGEKEGLELLGVESWALKSIPRDKRIQFLKGFAKFLARYHHPDLYIEEADKKKHQTYLARVNELIDRATNDRFFLEELLSDFNTEGSSRVRDLVQLSKSRELTSRLTKENQQLGLKLEEKAEEYKTDLANQARIYQK